MSKLKLLQYVTLFRVLFWLSIVVIYVASIYPNDAAPRLGDLSDKSQHILAFLVLGILIRFAYTIKYWYALFWLAMFGVLIEASQFFTPDRHAEYADILSDVVGSFIGLKLHKYLRRVLK